MENEYHNFIVKKSSELEIGQFDDSKDYIVTNRKFGNNVVINKKTLDVLNLVDGKTSLPNIVSKYNKENPSSSLDLNVAYELLYEKLGRQGIIVNENYPLRKKEIASYLALSFTLVNKKSLNLFTRIISPIINIKHFYKVLFGSLIIVLTIVALNYSKLNDYVANISLNQALIYVLVGGMLLFLHEFGHASACKKLGAEPGDIGFGFYLLSPVMFADVSDIWKLKRGERVYVNFAGLYIEIIVALMLVAIFQITNYMPLLVISSIVLFSFILNLNPFLRYDGYWILSDVINVPNLRKVSLQKLNLFFTSIKGKDSMNYSGKNVFLIIYAFISMVFIFAFLGFILIKDPNSIFTFPINLYVYGKSIVIGERLLKLPDMAQFILPFLFYFIVIKFAVSFITQKRNNLKGK